MKEKLETKICNYLGFAPLRTVSVYNGVPSCVFYNQGFCSYFSDQRGGWDNDLRICHVQDQEHKPGKK